MRETGGVRVREEQRAVRAGEAPTEVRPRREVGGGQQAGNNQHGPAPARLIQPRIHAANLPRARGGRN